jgi:hypothetical protein
VPAYQAAMWILPGVRKHRVNNFTKCQEISDGKKRQKFFLKKATKNFCSWGVRTGRAFNRYQRCRLKALPVLTPPGAKVFARFFQKALLSSACVAAAGPAG